MSLSKYNYLSKKIEFEKYLDLIFEAQDSLVIFDVGSCEELDSIRYSNKYPNAKIFAFEPLAENIEKIKQNLAEFEKTNVHVIELAITDSIGESVFYISSGSPEEVETSDWDYGNKSSSLLEPKKTKETHPWLKFEKKNIAETSTLDHICNEKGLGGIDLLHLDVQGAEMKVLEGALKVITDIKSVWLEVANTELYSDQPIKYDIEKYMRGNNFSKWKDTVGNISGDQFWVNKNHVGLFKRVIGKII